MRIEYQPGTSLLHRLDVRVKLLGFVVVLVATFVFGRWEFNLGLAVLAIGLTTWARIGLGRVLRTLAPLAIIVLIVAIFAAYSFRPESASDPANAAVLFSFPNDVLPLTVGGVSYGISLGLRIVTMVLLTTLLLFTTPIDDFVAAMRQARVPHAIVFIVMTALRFIPTMQQRADQVLDAQRARGAHIDDGSMIRRIRAFVPVMVPLLTSGIRMSDDLAAAMINRGWGATKRPTALYTLSMAPRDWLAIVVVIAALAAVIAASVHGIGAL
jgi:energy-coupling factor transporter transmembrane protein EcfT